MILELNHNILEELNKLSHKMNTKVEDIIIDAIKNYLLQKNDRLLDAIKKTKNKDMKINQDFEDIIDDCITR